MTALQCLALVGRVVDRSLWAQRWLSTNAYTAVRDGRMVMP